MWGRSLAGCAFAASVAACTLAVSTSGLSGGAADAGTPRAVGDASHEGSVTDGSVADVAVAPSGDGAAASPATSCRALMTATPPPSGVYTIDPDGSGPAPAFTAYCDLTGDGGGWTLLIKAAPDLTFDNAYWTDTRTLATDRPDLDLDPAKLDGFMTMPFDEVRVGIREEHSDVVRYVVLPVKAASLLALFQGAETRTSAGRDAWLSLFTSPSNQGNCNVEGFNLTRAGYAMVRVGIIFNNEPNCSSPDSYIGIGGWQGSGNYAADNGAAGETRIPKELGYIEVR